MGAITKIAWCDSTINDWEGCTKVSPGCANCYAEAMDRRMMIEKVIHWGPGAPRRKSKIATAMRASLNRKPWVSDCCGVPVLQRDSERGIALCTQCHNVGAYHRRRIFSLSQGDWLDQEVPVEWLAEMMDSIRLAQDCDHLLLTKRPELFFDRMCDVRSYALDERAQDTPLSRWVCDWMDGKPPEHIWVGATAEDQKRADERIPALLKIPAKVRFLSCEPLLGRIDLKLDEERLTGGPDDESKRTRACINQVIIGGESGPKARPCNVEWIRSIVRQCKSANVSCFVKQWGSRPVYNPRLLGGPPIWDTVRKALDHPKGGDPAEWPEDLRVQQFPEVAR